MRRIRGLAGPAICAIACAKGRCISNGFLGSVAAEPLANPKPLWNTRATLAMPSRYLYGRMKNVRFDVPALCKHYSEVVEPTPSVPYFDNGVNYAGWAMLSFDGEVADGVRKRPLGGGERSRLASSATAETPLCTGPMRGAIEAIRATGLHPYRARLMRLESVGSVMTFHVDAKIETWRLHVPLITNHHSFFEWMLPGGEHVKKHLPADGSAYFVRVDIPHRAINYPGASSRVHLLMGVKGRPKTARFADPHVLERPLNPRT